MPLPDLYKLARKAQVRLAGVTFVQGIVRGTFWLSIAYLALVAISRLGLMPGWSMLQLAGWLAVAILPTAVVYTVFRGVTLERAASALDENLGLKSRISSALELRRVPADADGPMAEALVQDARDAAARADVRRAFPLRLPREVRWLAVPMMAAALLTLVPQADLFGWEKQHQEIEEEKERVRNAAVELKHKLDQIQELTENSDSKEMAEIKEEAEHLAEMLDRDPERADEAMAEVNDLMDKLAERRKQLEAERPQATMKRGVSKSDQRNRSELGRKLADGDMEGAADELRKKLDALQNGEMDPKRMSEEADQLEQLADALQDPALGEQLRKAAEAMRQMSESRAPTESDGADGQGNEGSQDGESPDGSEGDQGSEQGDQGSQDSGSPGSDSGSDSQAQAQAQAQQSLEQAMESLESMARQMQELERLEQMEKALEGAKQQMSGRCPDCNKPGGT